MKNHITQFESLRGFAAIYVFLHHAHLFSNAGLVALFSLGQEAVILFFLLSGFVIYNSTHSDRPDRASIATYLMHRFRRIYPIMLLALLAAYVSACIKSRSLTDPMWTNLVTNVFMFQDASELKRGVWAGTYHGNSALWSLSYEWWFYMLFIPLGLTGRFSAALQRTIALAISVAGFLTYQLSPNQVSLFASYLIIWWAGVELAREYSLRGIVSLGEQSKTIASLAFCALLWFIPVANELLHGNRSMRMGVDPVLQFRHFAAALGIVLAGFAWRAKGLRFFDTTLGPFKLFAPISYSLYLFHLPVLNGLRDLEPGHAPAVRAIVALALLIPLCYLLEVRLQPIVNQLASRMFPGDPAGRKQPRAG